MNSLKSNVAQRCNCGCLPSCMCNVELPHSTQHAESLGRRVMPMVQLNKQTSPDMGDADARLQILVCNSKSIEDYTAEERRMFKERGEKLMKDQESEEKELWLPKKEEPIEDSGKRLEQELQVSRFQLAEVRNQLHILKKDLALHKKLVRSEVGNGYDLHQILNNKKWKGRAEEIKQLKAEIADLEARAYNQKYLQNPITIPKCTPNYPRPEDLIPKSQAEYLQKKIAHHQHQDKKKAEEVAKLMNEYGDLSLMYKAATTHNKLLAEELRSLKGQLAEHENKTQMDLELIKSLTAHQMQVQEMLNREAKLKEMVDISQSTPEDSEEQEELDAAKYKTLWEVSEYQKQSLLEMIDRFQQRLDDISKKTEEAEKHCEESAAQQKQLEEAIQLEAELKAKKKKPKKKKKAKQTLSPTRMKLESMQEENEFLKNFLAMNLETKKDDLQLYQQVMEEIKKQYLESLEKMKKYKELQEEKWEEEAASKKKKSPKKKKKKKK